MLAEILLCGLASANIGLKSISFDGIHDSIKSVDSLTEYIADDKLYDAGINIKNLTSYNATNLDYIERTYTEDDHYNDEFNFTKQIISPSFEESNNLKGYKSTVSGAINYVYDIDFYTFHLYSDATVKVIPGFSTYRNVQLHKIIVKEDGTVKRGMYFDARFNNLNNGIFYGICTSLSAGSYCISVQDIKGARSTYEFTLDVEYRPVTNEEIKVYQLAKDYKINSVAWISDYNPLGVLPFDQKTIELPNNDATKQLLDYKLVDYDRFLQSSLFVWGKETRTAYYTFFKSLQTEVNEKLSELQAEKVKLECARDAVGYVEKGFDLLLTGFSLAGKPFKKYISIPFSVIMAFAWALDECGSQKFSGGGIPDSVADIIDSFIPTGQIMAVESFKHYLEQICSDLEVDPNRTSDDEIVRVDSYYQFRINDNKKLELSYVKHYDRLFLSGIIRYNNENFPNSLFRGKFYKLKNISDFKDARKHIQHQYEPVDPSKILFTPINNNDEGGGDVDGTVFEYDYDWFSFTAKYTGPHKFYSTGIAKNFTDSLVGEIYSERIVGDTNEEKLLAFNDGDGYDKNFCVYYYLECGETIFLRIHGKEWKTINTHYIIHARYVDHTEPGWDFSPTPYIEKELSFEYDHVNLLTVRFADTGYKIIQDYGAQNGSQMKLFDSKGNILADNKGTRDRNNGNGFICADVYSGQYYFLKIYMPYSIEGKTAKITITSVDEYYETFNELPKITNTDKIPNHLDDFDIDRDRAALGVFTPDLTAHYEFSITNNMTNSEPNFEIYDTYTGENLNSKINGNNAGEQNGVYLLEGNRDYLIVITLDNPHFSFGHVSLRTSYYITDYYVLPIPVEYNMLRQDQYYEQVIDIKGNETKDFRYSFEQGGFKLVQLFGLSNNIEMEIYDIRNNLIENNRDSGFNNTALITFEAMDGELYRIRLINKNSISKEIKLTIVPVNNKIEEFNHIEKVSSNSDNQYYSNPYSNAVVAFTPSQTGMYSFRLYDRTFPVDAFIYVLDITSTEEIQENLDYNDNYNEHDDFSKVNRKLEQGKTYLIIISKAKRHFQFYTSLYLSIENIGKVLENSSYGRTNYIDFSMGLKDQSVDTLYYCERAGYTSFDATRGSVRDTTTQIDIQIFDYFTDVEITPLYKKVDGNKPKIIVELEKGHTYKITIRKRDSVGNFYKLYLNVSEVDNIDQIRSKTFGINMDDSRYFDATLYISKGQSVEYFLTFKYSGEKIIQTFGEIDTYLKIYDSSGKLVRSDDDGGYGNECNAFIKLQAMADEQYRCVIEFVDITKSGYTKLAVAPLYNLGGYDYYYNCEPLWLDDNKYSFTPSYGTCGLFTFKAPYDGQYSFALACLRMQKNDYKDTYLYVIDPSSTDELRTKADSPSDYEEDDNSNSLLQAKVVKNLQKGKWYFVVASFKNSYVTSSNQININISYLG